MKKRLTALTLALLMLCLSGCGGGAKSLTANIQAKLSFPEDATGEESAALMEFSLRLLRENWEGENFLISPLAVLSALGMTANGAQGETLSQMEETLDLSLDELNEVLASWRKGMPQERYCRASLANSLWLRDNGGFLANKDFLQNVVDWYRAEVFYSKFDSAALKNINGWVSEHTNGMISSILDEDIPDSAGMYLINALALNAEWTAAYREDQIGDWIFTTEDGQDILVEMMSSTESIYLEDGSAQGFIKLYKGGQWGFAALLPNEGISLEEYAASLTGERVWQALVCARDTPVETAVPKFQCEYSLELSDSLKALGMTNLFDASAADLSGMGTSSGGPLYISEVLQKSYIAVDERGTKAGAAAAVVAESGTDSPESVPMVYLNRPFLYMLVDMETHLPAFIGVVTDLS